MQLDIFEHSRDVMLRNDVLDALQRRDPVAARSAWVRFAAELPQDETLPLLEALIAALQTPDGAAFSERRDAHAALTQLREQIEPAAMRLLGDSAAAAWLLPLWRQLAQRCARLEFRADDAEIHAAPLCLRCADWPAAAAAVERIASWRRIPAPLAWMTEARYRLQSSAQPALQTAPERALRTLLELLGLERQGRQRELIEARKTLRGLHASLYAAYMRSR